MVALSLHEPPLLASSAAAIDIGEVDETFGLTGSLWPMMHTLADLLARRKYGEDVTQEAVLLEQSLSTWSVERHGASTDVDEEAMMQIAQTYKYSGLLALHICLIIGNGSNANHEKVEVIQRAAIDSLLRVCVLSGTMSTLTWPLYTVAMSSKSVSDRTVLQHVFSKLLERQHMKVVEGARDKILQTWKAEASTGTMMQEHQIPAVLLG
jgi:Fungal specific transcription factor domain